MDKIIVLELTGKQIFDQLILAVLGVFVAVLTFAAFVFGCLSGAISKRRADRYKNSLSSLLLSITKVSLTWTFFSLMLHKPIGWYIGNEYAFLAFFTGLIIIGSFMVISTVCKLLNYPPPDEMPETNNGTIVGYFKDVVADFVDLINVLTKDPTIIKKEEEKYEILKNHAYFKKEEKLNEENNLKK